MTDPEYLFKQTEIERKRIGRGDRNKKRGGGRYVRLPSDNMTKKEREAMNGEIKTYKVKDFYTWAEFKALPDDLQLKWVNSIINRFGCSAGAISSIVFGKSRPMLQGYLEKKGLTQFVNKGPMGRTAGREAMLKLVQAYKAWCDNCIIEAPNDVVLDDEIERFAVLDDEEQTAEETAKNVTEDAPPKNVTGKSDMHNIALLLQSLAGTGAKLTIEVTL